MERQASDIHGRFRRDPDELNEAAPSGCDGEHPATGAWHRLIGELKEYFAYYLSARAGRITATLKRVGVLAAIGLVGGIGAMALVVTATVLLLVGGAAGIARALGTGAWLGQIIVGGGLLLILAVGGWVFLKRVERKFLSKTRRVYERRKAEQRERFGRSVAEQAKAAGH